MKKVSSIIIISIFLFSTIGFLYAQDKDVPVKIQKKYKEKYFRGIDKELNLTEEQRKKLSKLRLENRKEMIKLNAELKLLEIDMKTLFEPKDVDQARIFAQIDKIYNFKKKMAKKRVDFSLKRRAILTQEQWDKIKNRRRHFFHNRMGDQSYPRHDFRIPYARPFFKRK